MVLGIRWCGPIWGPTFSGPKGKRPLLNGKFTFAAGFLDQSFFPDGLYTAPSDDALAYDIQVVPMFGMNMIRLHQKVCRIPHHCITAASPPHLTQSVLYFKRF